MVHPWNISAWEVEAGSGVQGYGCLHSELEANLGYMYFVALKKNKRKVGA